MLAAPNNPTRRSNDGTKGNKKYQLSFDAFDSPFHTPSLFGSIKYNDFNHQHSKYDAFYSSQKEDFRGLNYPLNAPQPTTAPPPSSESFFHAMVDLESSGTRTPSPNNDHFIGDDFFKVENTAPPFLYNHQSYQRKTELTTSTLTYPDTFSGVFYDQQLQSDDNSLHYIDRLSNDDLRHQLRESIDQIQRLVMQLNVLHIESEKKKAMFMNIQNTLANKDLEFQEKEQKLSLAVQYCDTQTKKVNSMKAEIAMYQSLVLSKGLELPAISGDKAVTMESSEIKFSNNKSKYPETSTSVETVRNTSAEPEVYYNTGRRWSEEKSLAIMTPTAAVITDKNVNVNWDSLVDRIITDTDQKASLFLQSKFKCATLDQKQVIFDSILTQVQDLMTNRFGNFLVQKLLELGTEEQVEALGNSMKGRILELTCQPFGCHVVQKALDHVSEPVKSCLVSELFVRIPETITHKYACHVWQKVFEIRWTITPPPMMKHVHASLKGHWDQVALDETGSLVIQNIFENLTEKDKRPILNEVLKNTVAISKGQWGNWVIQHILEQAEKSSDREAAFKIVIEEGVQLSTDQFASKVVEKALRIGGEEFLSKFIKRVSTVNHTHRHRMPLIDIASDQYGNYVVQWLINNATEEQRISICRLIKRHMVSLRGSKYGQRVAFLVEKVLRNVEVTTYPLASSSKQ